MPEILIDKQKEQLKLIERCLDVIQDLITLETSINPNNLPSDFFAKKNVGAPIAIIFPNKLK